MPGVQNKYSIDVINRFAIEDDDVEDEDAENIDPFEELKVLNQKAEDAKNAPKPKVVKKKAPPAKAATAPAADGEKKVERRSDRGGRGGGRGRGRDDRRPRQPRQGGGDAGAVEAGQTEGAIDRPKRFDGERRRRSPRGGARGGARGERRFDRKSRDPKSSQKPFEKKEGSGAGNWGTAEDELQGQTEKVEGQTEGEKTDEPKEEVEQKEEVPPPEPEEKTMTLEEYYASRKKSNRNPNAKLTDEKTPEAAKSFEKARQGRKARMAPVDFRPAPLVQRGGDRRGPRRDNRGDRNKQEKKTSGYDLASDFPSL